MSSPAEILTNLFMRISAKSVELEVGQTLLWQGSEDDNTVYLLMSGSLEVSHRVEGTDAVVATIESPGSLVGEIAALGGGKRSATVTASSITHLLSMPEPLFRDMVEGDPHLSRALVTQAVRRIEEGELVDLLAGHFGIVDRNLLVSVCNSVQWIEVAQGETLMEEGDVSDSMFFVIRGRLHATRTDPFTGESADIGTSGRGDAIGEIGLLSGEPRMATVTAVRDSVLAKLDPSIFDRLIATQPRMAVELGLRAVARAEDSRWRPSPATVLSVVAPPNLDATAVADAIASELERYGKVGRLSSQRVDQLLSSDGASNSKPGDIGDIRVSRVVHEAELGADHLLIELGKAAGPWARRGLGMSDRVLILTPPEPAREDLEHLDQMLGGCPTGVVRSLVVVHDMKTQPEHTVSLSARLGASEICHITLNSRDISRLARISVGRSNALVLSGGGGRGFAHIGVYRALEELGVEVDLVGGTSIGAVLGSVIADGKNSEEILEWAATHFPRVIDYTIPIVSLTKGERIARSALATFGERGIEDLWLNYFAISADLTTSRSHIHNSGSVALAIRATSAIPGVMPPVPFGDALLIDGGVLNNLPLDVARQRSPDGKLIGVDVAPPRGPSAHSDYGLSVSGWKALRSNLTRGRSLYPKMSTILMRSMITASMQQRDAMVSRGLADCYLDLDIRGTSMLDFKDAAGVAQRGYDTAMPLLEDWLSSRT